VPRSRHCCSLSIRSTSRTCRRSPVAQSCCSALRSGCAPGTLRRLRGGGPLAVVTACARCLGRCAKEAGCDPGSACSRRSRCRRTTRAGTTASAGASCRLAVRLLLALRASSWVASRVCVADFPSGAGRCSRSLTTPRTDPARAVTGVGGAGETTTTLVGNYPWLAAGALVLVAFELARVVRALPWQPADRGGPVLSAARQWSSSCTCRRSSCPGTCT